jgi:preprotein translocase subunit YajC
MIGASGGGGSGILFIIVIAFLLLWLIVVRPQRKRQNQQQEMLGDLRVGDEVLTAGGIYGTISHVDEDQVTVRIAPKTEVLVARRAIAGVTREEEEDEADETDAADAAEEPQEDDAERWESAFDDDAGSAYSGDGDTSTKENRG